MNDQTQTSEVEAAPTRTLVNDPQLRIHCLELATHLHNQSCAMDVTMAAQDYLNFVIGGPAKPPLKPVSDLPAHQQRVIDEKQELDERLERLETFLKTTKFEELDPEERQRLRDQAVIMGHLSDVLAQRIGAFLSKGGA